MIRFGIQRWWKIFLPWVFVAPFFLHAAGEGAGKGEPSSDPITLGEFYYECARAFRMRLPEGWEISDSWMLLRAAGLEVRQDSDFSQPLRERHVVEIGTQLGIQLTSENPDKVFSRRKVESFLTRFREKFRLPLRKRLREQSGAQTSGQDSSPPQAEVPPDE